MKIYNCPVCKKPLTRNEFEKALGILKEKEKHFAQEKEQFQRRLREAQLNAKKAKEEGIRFERKRTQLLLAGKDKAIQNLKERLMQLKKGSTPQTEGLEFEEKLVARLKREFPEDDIQHKGRGGDVLHIIKFEKKTIGSIIYECKRTPRIQTQHIQQAHLAKQSREAEFAVLVTTGIKKGFSGLAQMNGVLVVSPLAVIALASLLRRQLIEMMRANIDRKERVLIAQKLMKYITSPQFKNPIEDVVHLSTQLQDMIKEEARGHFRTWKKRWENYQRIQWDTLQVQDNLQLVLHGKEPKELVHPKMVPLQLPSPAE